MKKSDIHTILRCHAQVGAFPLAIIISAFKLLRVSGYLRWSRNARKA